MQSKSTPNPFRSILANVSSDWQPVTIEFLEYVKATVNYNCTRLATLEEAFKTLKYLEEHGIVELKQCEDYYQIRKLI